jgi:hypothetical protein
VVPRTAGASIQTTSIATPTRPYHYGLSVLAEVLAEQRRTHYYLLIPKSRLGMITCTLIGKVVSRGHVPEAMYAART